MNVIKFHAYHNGANVTSCMHAAERLDKFKLININEIISGISVSLIGKILCLDDEIKHETVTVD